MIPTPTLPRPAATLILVRDSIHGLEVFMMRRAREAKAFGGAYVFPGGVVDAKDDAIHWPDHGGFDDVAASLRLGIERGGLAYWLAAIRECYEEAGLLLAENDDDQLVRIDTPEQIERFSALRKQLNSGTLSFRELLSECKLRPAFHHINYLSHWVTPLDQPHRFDTRFFIALAPQDQAPSHDSGETTEYLWIHPNDALMRYKSGDFLLITATLKTLEMLSKFENVGTLMHHLHQPRHDPVNMPRRATGRGGVRYLLPEDYPYAEIAKLDPEGKGTVSYEIIPGVPVRLSSRVRRITAPNPGFMTGPGTNTYLLGASDEIAVIDPGPDREEHVQRLIDEAKGDSGNGRIRWILATHTHSDHSPAVARLKATTGAEVLGLPPPPHDRQDQTFKPERLLRHGDRIIIAGYTLRVIHTPGHASNHLCYLLEEEKILFTGDHLMQGSTVVINPPDGDMAAYLESLKAVQQEEIDYLAPGHGFLMDNHRRAIDSLLAHRLNRENKVLAILHQLGEAGPEQLLPLVYDDVPVQIHPVAARSLLAHLIKLQSEGKAKISGTGMYKARD